MSGGGVAGTAKSVVILTNTSIAGNMALANG
jgi:hypothetical protein